MNKFKKELIEMMKKNIKIIASNPTLQGKIPYHVLIAIAFNDGHTHILFPPEPNIKQKMINAINKENEKRIPVKLKEVKKKDD